MVMKLLVYVTYPVLESENSFSNKKARHVAKFPVCLRVFSYSQEQANCIVLMGLSSTKQLQLCNACSGCLVKILNGLRGKNIMVTTAISSYLTRYVTADQKQSTISPESSFKQPCLFVKQHPFNFASDRDFRVCMAPGHATKK